MKNILVTGGAGFIGSHVVKKLNSLNYRVIVFDNLINGHKESIFDNIFYKGDLRNIEDLEGVFKNENIDIVMHFAGLTLVSESMKNPSKYYENNICGGLNLLNTMNKYDCKKIIFSSSAAVYGESKYEKIKEGHKKEPTNPYGHTKLMFENILKWYKEAYNFSSISFRYFCAAGADKDGEIGELHNTETHVIPNAIFAALGKREKFFIFGDDYHTPDGTCIRDFIHVEDLADAHILAIDNIEKNICEQFNLGINKGFSVKEVVDSVKRVSNFDFEVKILERRSGDPKILVADSKKATDYFNWKPKYTNLDDIIKSAYNFYNNNI